MAILNEIIWRTQTTDFWVAFKAFGVIPLTMGFAITQMPLIKRYHLEPASLESSEAEAATSARVRFLAWNRAVVGVPPNLESCETSPTRRAGVR
jgi:hypothetical protein